MRLKTRLDHNPTPTQLAQAGRIAASQRRTALRSDAMAAPMAPSAPDAVPESPPDAGPPFQDGEAWRALLCVMGSPTGDGRQLDPAGYATRDLPLPHAWQPENQMEHTGAVQVGQITRCAVSGNEVWGFGTIDFEGENGQEYWRQLLKYGKYGISVDLDDVEVEFVFPDTPDVSGADDVEQAIDMLFAEPELALFTKWRIMGATATMFPAFPESYATPNPALLQHDPMMPGMPTPMPMPMPAASEIMASMVASATDTALASTAEQLLSPPAAWFDDPSFPGPMPLTITDDGHVFGHLAYWGTCHIGIDGICKTPPAEPDYGYYRTGVVVTAEGTEVPTGAITVGTNHAPRTAHAAVATAHYDNTGWVAADVAAGSDRFGIWLNGALRPGVTPQQVHVLRASDLSGDWRRIGGSLRLCAALGVNVGGFKKPRVTAGVADNTQISLVAAGMVERSMIVALQSVATRRLATEALDARIGWTFESRLARLDARVHVAQFGCGCGGAPREPMVGHLVDRRPVTAAATPAAVQWRVTFATGAEDFATLLAAKRAQRARDGSSPTAVRL